MTIEERLAYPLQAKPEMCSLNMGSMNFSIHSVAERITKWRYDWEKSKIEGMKDGVFKNTFADIEYILGHVGDGGTRFELECYDVGHLYNLAYFIDRNLIKPPIFIQAVFGILGGLGADPENLFVWLLHGIRGCPSTVRSSVAWYVRVYGRNRLPTSGERGHCLELECRLVFAQAPGSAGAVQAVTGESRRDAGVCK